ncbi:MAG: tetratricopeptide repeat protein [Gammaproteobacteria bacterium]|nr:tetratricopeptide repeat protein [Gammaproteobacteria bacterium]
MAGNGLSAKLAVILHADVVGSTELVRRDEKLAHARIQESFRSLGGVVGGYSGKVSELRGDALLAEFERASDAVCAALAFQSTQAEYLAQLDDDIRPEVRIGIALGEVVVADDTVTGAGVVLAQRLEQLAAPGGLCITPAIHEALPARLPLQIANLGPHPLKGFDHEVEIYRVSLRDGEILPPPETEAPVVAAQRHIPVNAVVSGVMLLLIVAVSVGYFAWKPTAEPVQSPLIQEQEDYRPSIAVLPFNNMSGDPEQDYFADGITEDLTTDLSKISGLFVVARNSAFSYKGRQVDVRTVGEELGVRFVLEGSVRRASNQVRINAQLIDASTGGHIWADRFDGALADVFALQDRVNRNIVAALQVTLTAKEEKQFSRVETTVPEAYDLLLRGIELYNVYTREGMVESRDLFQRAAELDPNYARAYANIALTHATEVNFYWSEDRDESIRQGLEFASRALAIDDDIPQIYLTRSILHLSQRQHDAALAAAKRTIEVHPGYADGHATLAFISSYMGRYQQGLDSLAFARRLNPQSTGVYLGIESRILFLLKRYQDALPRAEESVQRNPGFDGYRLNLAAIYAMLGRIDDAEWAVEEALTINPDLSLAKRRRDSLYKDPKDIDHMLQALRQAGLPEDN